MYEIFEQLCNEKGVTPYKVSKETGISRTTFSDWKGGKYELKYDKLERIADYFGVTVDYLMTGNDENHYYIDDSARELANEIAANPKLKILFDASRNVKEEDLQIVIDLVKRFTND